MMTQKENPAASQGERGKEEKIYKNNNAARYENQENNSISIFQGIDPKPIDKITWNAAIEQIKSPEHPQRLLVENIRKTSNKAARDALKEKLRAYTFSGIFSHRKNANITTTTGFIILDIDHIPDVAGLLALLRQDPLVWFCFVSPSGDGIKAGIRTQGIKNDADHKIFFAAVERYCFEIYGIKIDPACKDISRLTFTSYDPDAWINPTPEFFDVGAWTPKAEPEEPIEPIEKNIRSINWPNGYVRKVLENACNRIRQSQEHSQHHERLRVARLIGGYIAGGYLDESEALTALEAAVEASGAKNMTKAMKTISDGIRYGKQSPIKISTVEGQDHSRPDPQSAQKAAEEILSKQDPCGPFNIDAMPELVKRYVNSICRSTDADPALVLVAVISALSARIGRRCYLPETEYFNKLFCNVWFLVLSLSGSFKTTAMNKGCRIVWQKQADVNKRIKALKQAQAQLDTDALKKQIIEIEKDGCLLPNRMSAEGLLVHLSNGAGGLLACSEFGEWLANLGKSHNAGLKPLFTDLYDVPIQYSYMTKGGGHLVISRPFISIFGVSTLDWMRENVILSDIGSGFFARIMPIYPPQKKIMPPALPTVSEPVNIFTEQTITERLDKLPDDLPMHLKPDARAYFEKIHAGIYAAMEQLTKRDQELLAPYIKRWSPDVLKVAMIFQAIESPESWIKETVEGYAGFVSVDNIRAAAEVVSYSMQSTVYLFKDQLGLSKFQTDCKAVLEYIAKRGGTVERCQLVASRVLTDGVKQYDEILETLGQQNLISVVPHKQNIKKYEKIQLVE